MAKSDATSFVRLGAAAFAKEDFAAAIVAAECACQADAACFDAWLLLGAVLARTKQERPAVEAYLKALSLKPDDVRAWADLGELYTLLLKYDEAVAALRQAILLDPKAEHPAGVRARAVAGRTMALLKRG